MNCDNIKVLVLCEGYTDQLFVNTYIVGKNIGYENVKSERPKYRLGKYNIDWLKNKYGEYVGIIQNVGHDFKDALNLICRRKIQDKNDYTNICIITDHDENNTEIEVIKTLQKIMNNAGFRECDSTDDNTFRYEFTNSFGENREMDISLIVVPLDKTGALETFMLDSMSNGMPDRRKVIDYSKKVIEEFESDFYLQHRRDRVKAEMGVAYSIFDPERGVKTIKELITETDWATYDSVDKQFYKLIQLLV